MPGLTRKSVIKDDCLFFKVSFVDLIIVLVGSIIHATLNAWKSNFYLLPRIKHFLINKLNSLS